MTNVHFTCILKVDDAVRTGGEHMVNKEKSSSPRLVCEVNDTAKRMIKKKLIDADLTQNEAILKGLILVLDLDITVEEMKPKTSK